MPTAVQWIVAVLGAGGGGKFIWDIFTARSQNRKNNTDSAVMLINSATGYSQGLVDRINSINQRFDDFRRDQEERNRQQENRNREQDKLLLRHSQWDHKVAEALRSRGVKVEEPPPLFLEGKT